MYLRAIKTALLALTLAAASVLSFGQGGTVSPIRSGGSLPTACADGLFIQDGVGLNFCDSSGVLNLLGLASTQTNPTPGVTGVVTGGGVAWVNGTLSYIVSPATYSIAGSPYSSPQITLTLAAADPSNDRIDIIAVDNTGTALIIQGTPSATPAAPNVDPATQVYLTFAYVAANAATPSNLTETDIYLENTEWTCAATAHLNCASTNNPYAGTKDIEATAAVAGNNVTLTKPSTTLKLSSYNNLVFYIRSKANWVNTKSISISWLNGTTVVGTSVGLKTGQYGFSSTNTASYQQIVIPVTAFAAGTNNVSVLKLQVAGGGAAIGYYIDNVSLQGGIVPPPVAQPTMLFRGTWSSSASYNINDVVLSNGLTYVALLANTNSTPSGSAANWSPQVSALPNANLANAATTVSGQTCTLGSTCAIPRGIPFTIGVPGGTALTVAATTTDYITVPFGCTIAAYNLVIDAGTITVKFWKVATGTAIPTSGNSISTSGVGIASGTAIHSATVTDFTSTTVTANDIMAMNVTAVATAAYVQGVLQCNQ